MLFKDLEQFWYSRACYAYPGSRKFRPFQFFRMGGNIGMGGKSEWVEKSEGVEWAELEAKKSEWAEFAGFWIMVEPAR